MVQIPQLVDTGPSVDPGAAFTSGAKEEAGFIAMRRERDAREALASDIKKIADEIGLNMQTAKGLEMLVNLNAARRSSQDSVRNLTTKAAQEHMAGEFMVALENASNMDEVNAISSHPQFVGTVGSHNALNSTYEKTLARLGTPIESLVTDPSGRAIALARTYRNGSTHTINLDDRPVFRNRDLAFEGLQTGQQVSEIRLADGNIGYVRSPTIVREEAKLPETIAADVDRLTKQYPDLRFSAHEDADGQVRYSVSTSSIDAWTELLGVGRFGVQPPRVATPSVPSWFNPMSGRMNTGEFVDVEHAKQLPDGTVIDTPNGKKTIRSSVLNATQ